MPSVLILVTQVNHFGKFMYDMSYLFLNGDFLSSSEFLLAVFRTDSTVKHKIDFPKSSIHFWGIQLESMYCESTGVVGLCSITS